MVVLRDCTMQFSNTCVHLRLCDCTMQWLCQPTNDLLITRVLSSSVVRASDCCLEGCGCNSHLELRIFCVLLYSCHSSYWLCFSFQISNDECWNESFLGSTSELHQQFIFCFMCSLFLSNITDKLYHVEQIFYLVW